MTGKAQQAAQELWAGLNARQRLYLATIFEFDQQAEAEIQRRSARWIKTPPASEWRQITYDIELPKEIAGYSSVQSVLRNQGEHDPGSGSTLRALRTRGLITVTRDRVEVLGLGWVPRIRVRLTRVGRATARHGAGRTTPATTPKGLMARWSFAAMALLYAAGERGLGMHAADRQDRAPSWNTLLKLRDRRDGSFIEEYTQRNEHGGVGWRVGLTSLARRHYEIHYACYRELYPDIEAPEPVKIEGAHSGLAVHRTRRERHLLRDTDLRVLAALVELEGADVCHLRSILIKEYERGGQPVPDDVRAIPPGLLRWQVKELARSEKPIDRLIAHPGGPLIEVIDVPNSRMHLETRPTLPLIVVTQGGRDHLNDHAGEYRELYPDLSLPKQGEPR